MWTRPQKRIKSTPRSRRHASYLPSICHQSPSSSSSIKRLRPSQRRRGSVNNPWFPLSPRNRLAFLPPLSVSIAKIMRLDHISNKSMTTYVVAHHFAPPAVGSNHLVLVGVDGRKSIPVVEWGNEGGPSTHTHAHLRGKHARILGSGGDTWVGKSTK